MTENQEQLRSCLKPGMTAEPPRTAVLTPKRVCFAMLDEIKEYTPPYTDDSTNSIDSPLVQQKPTELALAKVPAASPSYSSPCFKPCGLDDCSLSPATEIDFEPLLKPCPVPPNTSELSAPLQESNTSIINEPGIEDMTAGNLNETSDDFVCSLMHSVDMSMTFSSEDFQKCSSENTKSPGSSTPSSQTRAKLELFTPDICTGSTPKSPSSFVQAAASIPREGVWKKFRILSPFSMKSRPTVEIRSVDVRVDCKAPQASLGFPLNPAERSAECFPEFTTTSQRSLEDKTLPFTSDDESDQDDKVPISLEVPYKANKSRVEPPKEPEFPSRIQTSKSWSAPFKKMTKDPLKTVKDLKISKVALKKAKKGPQNRKPHLGIASLVERLRNASLEDDYFYQDSSPERPIMQADLSPERHDLYDPSSSAINQTPQHLKAKSRSRSQIPRPVKSVRTAVEQSSHNSRTQSEELNQKSGLGRPRLHHNNEAIVIVNRTSSIKSDPKAAINRLIKEVKVLHGVEKIRKLDSLAKLYLRRANDDTFFWAISKLTGYAHQDFIKAEQQFRDIQRLIRNPMINSDEGAAKDSKRIFAAVKMDAMSRRLHQSIE